MLNPDQFPSAAEERASGQLSLFMSASEIKNEYAPLPEDRRIIGEHPDRRAETDEDLWARKLSEAGKKDGRKQSLVEHIRSGGETPPIHLALQRRRPGGGPLIPSVEDMDPTIAGGHHRVAAYNEVDPDKPLNVLHHSNVDEALNIREVQEMAYRQTDVEAVLNQHPHREFARDYRSGVRYR